MADERQFTRDEIEDIYRSLSRDEATAYLGFDKPHEMYRMLDELGIARKSRRGGGHYPVSRTGSGRASMAGLPWSVADVRRALAALSAERDDLPSLQYTCRLMRHHGEVALRVACTDRTTSETQSMLHIGNATAVVIRRVIETERKPVRHPVRVPRPPRARMPRWARVGIAAAWRPAAVAAACVAAYAAYVVVA